MVDGFNICAGALSFEEALCPPCLELDHLLSSDLSASINTTFNGKLFQLSGEISKRLLTLQSQTSVCKAEHATLVLASPALRNFSPRC